MPAQTRNAHTQKTRDQLYKGNGPDWGKATPASAREYLVQKDFVSGDCDPTPSLATLALVLLRVADTAAQTAIAADALRAVVLLLEKGRINAVMESIAEDVEWLVVMVETLPRANSMEPEGADEGMSRELRSAAEMLTRTVEEQCDNISRLTSRLEDEVTEIVQHVGTAALPEASAKSSADPIAATTHSYAVAATTGVGGTLPPAHAAILATAAARMQQILIERAPQTEGWLNGLSEKEIVEKARMGLSIMMPGAATPHPEGATFVGAVLQRDGAVLLHMNSAEGWDGALHTVESDNNMPTGSLAKARWIKPVDRRHANQRVAHAVFGFKEAGTANLFLQNGAYVEGKLVYGHKLLTEPCGEMHMTKSCTVANDRLTCANCKIARRPYAGHGAADRSCPVFLDKLQFALERNQMRGTPISPLLRTPVRGSRERRRLGRVPDVSLNGRRWPMRAERGPGTIVGYGCGPPRPDD
ncbi:hypothetical protein B0H19DRAFT_1081293 [Mycena capillaripes]|nr:hypothetical protein B0H19DRAFT_1081263 [Mycena capillaripes]KAJ6533117.1 hypothetical protein B0H19DRAFT_1081293 [Mycena capillaripes]